MNDSGSDEETIVFSPYTEAFTQRIAAIQRESVHFDGAKINVSRTVSFFAILYEKIRNSIEFREESVVRRAAVERIIKRRLSLNPEGTAEGENIVRELLWARYIPSDYMTQDHVKKIQKIIDRYIFLSKQIKEKKTSGKDSSQFVFDLLSAEIEESLEETEALKKSAYLYFFFQVLHQKVRIDHIDDQVKDSYFYAACEAAYQKNDNAYIRYHLFVLQHAPLGKLENHEIEKLSENWAEIEKGIDTIIKNRFADKLARIAKKQVPPFLILYEIIERNKTSFISILASKEKLLEHATLICNEKYKETSEKLRTAAIRSIIYIFLTKMIFVLILEFPLTKAFYGVIHYPPLFINSLFPPLLMGLIVSFIRVPTKGNTIKIYDRIVNILNRDPSFETAPFSISKKARVRRPVLILGFTFLYIAAFGATFAVIYYLLDRLHFNIISKSIFIFFLTIVAFFGYRIRQTAKEYSLEQREGIFSPIIYFFFLPILSVGKFLSGEIAKLNILMAIFDFLIEAPFKIIFDIVEEWVKFVRSRKDDII